VRRLFLSLAVFLSVLVVPIALVADVVALQNVRMWKAPDHTRLVFDLSGPVEHRIFELKDPDRLVIDVPSASLLRALPAMSFDGPVVKDIRTGKFDGALRIVLDLKYRGASRAFLLKPFGDYGYRLVLDLDHPGAETSVAAEASSDAAPPAAPAPELVTQAPPQAEPRRPARDHLVIAIDAGHGGEDPGAIGRRYRTREKDVVLAIARYLQEKIDRDPQMKAVMVRDGDYYVSLNQRRRVAHKARADLFISIHADSLPGSRARGASVYALSQRGATSSQARILAERENSSDLIGGISINDKDPIVKSVLYDLAQTSQIMASLDFGRDLLKGLESAGPIHVSSVGQAGFAVLKSPDIPSVLVETAFISNAADEKRLRTRRYQKDIADGIYDGIKRFVKRKGLQPSPYAVPTRTVESGGARRTHRVRRGDSLTAIAARYDVSVDAIRLANDLDSNRIQVGASLLIP
jgi:N-acetylmuramoyl-L-alanine amidase